MIDFDTWLRNIVATSDLIASEDALWKAWVDGDQTITSAYDYSELATQVLGDLELEEQTKRFSSELEKLNALARIKTFICAFLNVDKAARDDSELADGRTLLKSTQWATLRNAARDLSSLPALVCYRGEWPSLPR
jgi:hypothetical protein